jgi:hypothetical protein
MMGVNPIVEEVPMNILRGGFVCGVTGVVFGLATMALVAQAPSIAVGGHEFGRGFGPGEGFGAFRGAPVTGAPYSAVRTTTHVQTLANGATITHTSQVKEARDSSGRTYFASVPNVAQGAGGARSFVHVYDPVSRETISWSSNSKQATLVHLPDANQVHTRGMAAGAGGGSGRFHGHNDAAKTEDLGSKTINGLVVNGTRMTRVIPAGAQGNSEALTVTHETWVSADLKLEVQRTDTDPRFGTTTVEVGNIDRAEPSAALFQAPTGFTVNERTMGQRGSGFAAAP